VRNTDELGLGAVDAVAEDPAAGAAVRVHELPAINALATSADAGDQDPVSRLERRDGWPGTVDDSHSFVTKNAARLTTRDVTLEDVEVRAADGRFRYFDDRVGGRCDFRLWPFFQGLFRRTEINESLHF
jgi:hypothetical protein